MELHSLKEQLAIVVLAGSASIAWLLVAVAAPLAAFS